MNQYQEEIKRFCEERNWAQFHNPKDLLLGIVEEVGELRNLVKWEQDPVKLKESLLYNKKAAEDGVGDILWFLSLLANSCNVDFNEAILATIENNKKRFSIEKTKNIHTNTQISGYDGRLQ